MTLSTTNDETLPCNRLAKTTVPSYRVSPINELESDPDLSDDDPTFKIVKSKTFRSFYYLNSVDSPATNETQQDQQTLGNGFSFQSQSSADPEQQPSGSVVYESNVANRRPKKRPRNPEKWKQNIAKSLRNTGKSYISQSKSKRELPARSMKEPCTCLMKCSEKIDETCRKEIFNSFWQLGSIELQRMFIKSCMMEIQPKYKYTNAEKPRAPNNAFFFSIGGSKIRVCKKYFINTLDITDRQIRTVKAKSNSTGFLDAEQRGKHKNRKTTDEKDIQDIKAHINSIPRIPSHLTRADSEREYIAGGKTIKDLWRDLLNIREKQNKHELPYWLYHNIFTTKFNISFYQPKKDKCDFCLEYEFASLQQKEMLQETYDMHITEKTICRLEKKEDRNNINETNICAVYDLQAIMQCPKGETSSFYYVSKLNCINFTIAELTKKTLKMRNNSDAEDLGAYNNVYCYFWDETQAKRGSNEIGSCVYEYIKNLSEKSSDQNILHITFYSDNCSGQNKNKYITSLYAYMVAKLPNIGSITHKFLITGHTQNEGDNVHSLIEKEIKKSLKSGPIYSPHEYISLIKSAKKSGTPFKVHELSYDAIIDLKALQNEWGYNFNEDDDDREQFSWGDIRVLRFVKNEPFVFYYKTSYTQDKYKRVNMRNKRKKMPCIEQIDTKRVFQEKLKLSENTRKGLKELLRKKLIPNYYVDYYQRLVSEN